MSEPDVSRVAYLSLARTPIEWAHGYQICKMCEAMAEAGPEVTLIHPCRHQPDPALRETDPYAYYDVAPVFETRQLGRWDPVHAAGKLHPALESPAFTVHMFLWGIRAAMHTRRDGADVCYVRHPPLAYWALRLGLPVVLEIHRVPKRLQRRLLKTIAQDGKLRLVVALTTHIRGELIDLGFSPDRVVVLPDAVDPRKFEGLPSRAECRRRLDLPGDAPIVGYVGRFHALGREKGLETLIRAVAGASGREGAPDPWLLAVGGPMDREDRYRAVAREAGLERLILTDRVPNREVPLWIRACDVATIPWPWTEFSAHYTSPLKLFEYMAAGVPIVASDLPALREVIEHGRHAWLVEPGSATALARGIDILLDDPGTARRLAEAARERVREYTWSRRAAAVLDRVWVP